MRKIVIMCAAAAMSAFAFAGASAAEKAPSPCKGLAETVCKENAKCSWIKPTKSKKGKEIAGYCRLKPAKKAKTAPAPTPAPAPAPKG